MAGDSLSEQEIQFRKRARRRLIGAVALVLLMVTLLPMVLDDQAPEAPEQEIAITIPSQDGADFSSKVTPAPAIPATGPAPAPVEMSPPVVAAPTPPAANGPAAQVNPGKPPAAKAPAAPLPSADAPVKPLPLPATKSSTASAATADTELPEAKAEDTATTAKSGFSVQIGVFSDAAKVKRLQSRLKDQGIATYTEKLGNKIRMRSGPYPTRVAAEEVQARLKQMKMASMVVTNK